MAKGRKTNKGEAPVVETYQLTDDGNFPNSRYPLIIIRNAVSLRRRDPGAVFEKVFCANDWSNSWRDGIYAFHHYHSTAHEVLGVYRGQARVQFGGVEGVIQDVGERDVIIIPAGVAHKSLTTSRDFGVVGAYAGGAYWDINYGRPTERPETDSNIAKVPLPTADPVFGGEGPVVKLWN